MLPQQNMAQGGGQRVVYASAPQQQQRVVYTQPQQVQYVQVSKMIVNYGFRRHKTNHIFSYDVP